MKLTVLSDNNTLIDRYLFGEPAFCCYIEAEGRRFLLDTGYFGTFAQNAEALGIDWRGVDGVILSHAHDDHTRGLKAFLSPGPRPRLYAHPGLFRPIDVQGLSIGCPYDHKTLEKAFELVLTEEPLALTENLFYLGAIPRVTPFEGRAAVGKSGGRPDFCPDDTALAYGGREGVYVITGCSHSGIINILERAKTVTGKKRVMGVIGGFHLRSLDEGAQRTIDYLEREHISALCPCHCTALSVKVAMGQRMKLEEVGTGTCLHWE